MKATRKTAVAIGCVFALIVSIWLFGSSRRSISDRDEASGGATANGGEASAGNRREGRNRPTVGSKHPAPPSAALSFQISRGELTGVEAWETVEKSGLAAHELRALYDNIIRHIAKKDGATAALQFLNGRVGAGSLRDSLLWGVFSDACNDIDGAALALSALEFPDKEMAIALEGIGSSFAVHEGSEFDVGSIVSKLPPEVIPSICQSLIFEWQRNVGGDQSEVKSKALGLFSQISASAISENKKEVAEAEVFDLLATSLPSVAWALIEENGSKFESYGLKSKEALVGGMIAENPERAFSEFAQYKGVGKAELIEAASYDLARRNSTKVVAIKDSVLELRTTELNDAFALGVIKYALEAGESESAKAWSETIINPEVRAQFAKQFSSK